MDERNRLWQPLRLRQLVSSTFIAQPTNGVDGPVSADLDLTAAEQAQRAGDYGRALALYLEAAMTSEHPPADLCLKIARCHDRLESPDEAFTWLARIVDASDGFRHWSAGASLLARLVAKSRPSTGKQCRVAVTGSYTVDQFAAMLPLAALSLGIDLELHSGLYGQYQQDLIDPGSALYSVNPDLIVVAVHEGAAELPRYSDTPDATIAAETSRWVALWDTVSRHSDASLVQHNFALRPESEFGHLSRGLAGSRFSMLQTLNRALSESATQNVNIVDCARLAAHYGTARWFDDRYWVRSKQAVALEALPLLARHTAAVIAARLGLIRKCLVLDLDNTLWGGVIGEDGLDGIQLGSDGIGEAFVAFQEAVLALKDRGVLLAVASKNNEADVREVFERHPAMRIKLEDISAFAVNWEDKPANLRAIARTLGIGLDALVLADDNPAERQIVRRLVPEVDVLTLPVEPAEYRRALSDYLGFEPAAITSEDRQRTAQYRARRAAAEMASSATDMASFYRDMRMTASTAPFDDLHMPRIGQLTGKTNQFNLTTRRFTAADLRAFSESEKHITRYLRLSDRLADHGLVALTIAEIVGDRLDINSFLMSCRVIGRTVEDHLLSHLCRDADRVGCKTIHGTYIPTHKNAIVSSLYERFGFIQIDETDDGITRWQYDLSVRGPIVSEYIEEVGEHDSD